MKKAGIKIVIDNTPSADLFGKRLPGGNFDIADFAWVGTPFAISSNQSIYSTTGGQNYGKYTNPKVDALFKSAIANLDPKAAVALSQQIDQQLWDDMATLPLYQKPTFIAYDKSYSNIHDNSTSEGPFYNAAEWSKATS